MPNNEEEDMSAEYDLDYSKAKPNRFAGKYQKTQRAVVLDSDIASAFPTAEAVNDALRSLLEAEKQANKV